MKVITHIGASIKFRPPVVPYRLGMITQNLTVPLTFDWEVQAGELQDHPLGTGKGHTYMVADVWVLYMRKVMTVPAWNWWIKAEKKLMINRSSKWGSGAPDEMPMFENIGLPNNFVAFDKFYLNHGRVVGKSSVNFDTSVLDPRKDNWYYKPTEYWAASTQAKGSLPQHPRGEVGKVGDGSYFVYTPVIRQQPEQWCHLSRVELFPPLPLVVTYQGKKYTITGYAPIGASIFGHADEMDVPLRLVTYPGQFEQPCPEFQLKTAPLIPELKPDEWKI